MFLGVPGGSLVKDPPANAGDTGSIPDLRRFQMLRSNWVLEPQLPSLCSRAQELQLLKRRLPGVMLWNEPRHLKEKPVRPSYRVALTQCNQGKAQAAMKTQGS